MDSLSYCIYIDDPKELLILKTLEFSKNNISPISLQIALETIWSEEATLSLPYRTIKIFTTVPHYTIIPNRLYSAKDKAHYLLPLKSSLAIKESFFANALPSIDAQMIFALPTTIIKFLERQYGDRYELYHSFTSLIEEFSRQSRQGKEMYVNVRDYHLQAFFFDNKELIFSNQFTFQSDKDFLYYLLLIYDQFKLNPKEVPLHIAGTLSVDSAIYSQLYKYIQDITFVNLPAVFRADVEVQQYPAHLFFDLLHTV